MFRFLALLLLLPALSLGQQIHAHNDYEKPNPLVDAYQQRADFIEADVFLVNGKLVVAHERKQIDTTKTLESLYLNPIVALFEKNGGYVSPRRDYTFSLVIDMKDGFEEVIPKLVEILQMNLAVFNRGLNPNAVRIVLSGNRPKPAALFDYPPYIFFDGRPSEVYDSETLQRVALISDSFLGYSRWDGTGDLPDADREKLKRVIRRAHGENKPIRFWAIPDVPNAWKQLRKLGVDVINTDKVAEATAALK
ncbi:MAG: glycerophosphodiester phosphodiesterase [Bacteroidetes bacterium]|nr:glycerophosphodiester phosphodiesterase [Fibrella sp.]